MLDVLSGLATLLSSGDACWPFLHGTDCRWVVAPVEVTLGVENGNSLCAIFDDMVFGVESRVAVLGEVVLGNDDVGF